MSVVQDVDLMLNNVTIAFWSLKVKDKKQVKPFQMESS